tara:strand:- start:134 stop:2062 length:1929 start_codon:yes stop_codon:yes gene_type:complete
MFDIDESLKLLGKVVMKLNEMGKFNQIKEVTFIYFDCNDQNSLNVLKTHPLTKNIITVGKCISEKDETIISMTKSFWNKNQDKLYEQTKNSFFIHSSKEDTLQEMYSSLKKYSNYYPMVVFEDVEGIKKTEISKAGYSSYSGDGFICCVNKNLRNFDSYHINDFQKIEKEDFKTQKGKNIFRSLGKGIEVPINIKKRKETLQVEKNEEMIDFSFLSGLKEPRYEKELNKYNIPTSKRWLQEFYEYLRDLLSRIFPKERRGLIDIILTNDTLKSHWIPCFTHVSANPNPGRNYESIETIGDAGMGYCFKFYVKWKEPYAEESRISNLNQQYMSKDFQSRVSKMMKLQEWLITCGIPSDRMDTSEDLLEALCGTIDKLLFIKRNTTGLGVIIIYNLMGLLFDNITFSDEASKNTEPDRTYVEQFFSGQAFRIVQKQQYTDLRRPKDIPEKLWEKIITEMNKTLERNDISPVIIKEDKESHRGIIEQDKLLPDGKTMVTVKIMKSYADMVRSYGLFLEGKGDILIGKYISNTKKTAEKMAYARAKQFMVESGLTKEWKNSVNKKKKNAALQNKDRVFEKAKYKFPEIIEGSITISRLKTIKINGRDVVTYQIRGTDENGKIIPIFTLTSQDKAYEQGVIDEYLDK